MGLAGFGVSFSIDMPLLTELRSHRDNMNDDQLNHLLKSARVPEREPVYWDEFPSHVRRQLSRESPETRSSRRKEAHSFRVAPVLWAMGLAAGWVMSGT